MATTAEMGLVTPTVNVTPGPTWAQNVNTDLGTIDAHNHTAGRGAQVPTAGININQALSFASFDATDLRTARFTSQIGSLSSSADVRCIYVVGNELYYNDGINPALAITSNGGLNAAAIGGGIGGQYGSGGSVVSYLSSPQTYYFTANGSTIAGSVDVAEVVLHEAGAVSSNGITLKSPPALAASYDLTFPSSPPGQTELLTMDANGMVAPAVTIASLSTGSFNGAFAGTFTSLSGASLQATSGTVAYLSASAVNGAVLFSGSIDASGSVRIAGNLGATGTLAVGGNISTTSSLGVSGSVTIAGANGLTINGAGSNSIQLTQAAAAQYIAKSGGTLLLGTFDSNSLTVFTNNIARANFDASGNFGLVGGTRLNGLLTPVGSDEAATKGYVDPGMFLSSGYVRGSDGALVASKGAITPSSSRNSAGNYSIGVAGLTSSGIMLVSVVGGGSVSIQIVSLGSSSANVTTTTSTTGGSHDTDFTFMVIKL